MTDQEWLASTDPVRMLKFLRGRMSDRKLRLFAVACARLLEDRLPDDLRGAVDVGERLADGRASEEERLHFVSRLYDVVVEYGHQTGRNWFQDTPQPDISAHFAALKSVGRWKPDSNVADWPGWQNARLAI